MKRWIVLALALALLCSWAPMSAHATGTDVAGLGTPFSADARTVVAAIFIGLGISPGEDVTVFDDLVSNCLSDLTQSGAIVDGKTTMYALYSDSGLSQTLVDAYLIELVRAWIFENGIVESVEGEFASYNGVILPVLPEWDTAKYLYALIAQANYDSRYYLWLTSVPTSIENGYPRISDDSYILQMSSDGVIPFAGSWTYYYKTGTSINGVYIWSSSDPISGASVVSEGLTAGEIASFDLTFTDGYSVWASVPYELDGFTLYPLAIKDSYSDVYVQGQNETWQGLTNNSVVDSGKPEETEPTDPSGSTGPDYSGQLGAIEGGLNEVEDSVNKVGDAVDGVADQVQESNSKLQNVIEGITSLPEKILEGVKGLFVPDAEYMAEYQAKWDELLKKRFGLVYEAGSLLQNLGEFLTPESGIDPTFEVPSVSVDVAGVPWTFGGWTVDIVPEGFDFLQSACRLITSILATFVFLTSMRNRFDRLLGGF